MTAQLVNHATRESLAHRFAQFPDGYAVDADVRTCDGITSSTTPPQLWQRVAEQGVGRDVPIKLSRIAQRVRNESRARRQDYTRPYEIEDAIYSPYLHAVGSGVIVAGARIK